MRIGIDGGVLGVSDNQLKTGVFVMFSSLLKELTRIDKINEYILYSFIPIEDKILNQFTGKVKNIVVKPRKGWNYFALPLELIRHPVDLFIGPSQSLPLFGYKKSIAIIHDLAFEYFPDCYGKNAARLHWLTLNAVKRADLLVAVSAQTKKDLITSYGVKSDRIKVIHEACEPIFKPQSNFSINKIKEKYLLPDKYILFVGSLKKIKNVVNIIKSFSRYNAENKSDLQLVLAGSNIWLDKEIVQTITDLKIEDEVINLGFIPHEELPPLYGGAHIFVSPSLYEGFGLPLVEAMSCGVPVITSDRGAMKEVVDDAGLLVNPDDPKDISRAISLIINDEKFRKEMTIKGQKRANDFSWEKSAKQLLQEINKFK